MFTGGAGFRPTAMWFQRVFRFKLVHNVFSFFFFRKPSGLNRLSFKNTHKEGVEPLSGLKNAKTRGSKAQLWKTI